MKTASHRSRMAVKSAPQKNKLPPWQHQLDEVQNANPEQAKDQARQHFSRLFDEKIDSLKRRVEEWAVLVLESRGRAKPKLRPIRDAANGVFRLSGLLMWRLDPGIAAVTKVAGGTLSAYLAALAARMQKTGERLKEMWQPYRGPAGRSMEADEGLVQRQFTALIDALEADAIKFYASASARYGLPALNGWRFLNAPRRGSTILQKLKSLLR